MVRVVFYLVGTDSQRALQARMMIQSIRRVMKAWIVQLTDMETPALWEANEVRRLDREEPMVIHAARLKSQEMVPFLKVDTDMIFLEDVSDVFSKPFDVAMPRKKWNLAPGKTPRQLYNGVSFVNNPRFWPDMLAELQGDTWKGGNWCWKHSDKSLTTVGRRYDVLDLDGQVYNYEPVGRNDPIGGKKILHFKAWRKELMDAYA